MRGHFKISQKLVEGSTAADPRGRFLLDKAAASVCSEEFLVRRVYPRCKVFAQSAHFAPDHYKLNED
jgi:hypothetical protein